MRNDQLKQELKAAFSAPQPRRKAEFLRQAPVPSISNVTFIWMQLRFLRRSFLLLSAAAFGVLLLFSTSVKPEMLWLISAVSPFLALSILTTKWRSYTCGMEELEFATRFSLKSLMLARMGSLSALHAMILLAGTLCLGRHGVWLLEAGAYLLLPYCTTISVALPLTRKYHGRELPYLCVFVSALVSAGVMAVHSCTLHLTMAFAMLVLAIEGFIIVSEIAKFIRQTEELSWNYN